MASARATAVRTRGSSRAGFMSGTMTLSTQMARATSRASRAIPRGTPGALAMNSPGQA